MSFRYRGHCPTTKYDYGETYGNATNKYFQDYRSEVLNASHDPYARGGEFPTYYTHRPESVISARGRTRDRWLAAPKYNLSNVDFDRKEELKSFDTVRFDSLIIDLNLQLKHKCKKKCIHIFYNYFFVAPCTFFLNSFT